MEIIQWPWNKEEVKITAVSMTKHLMLHVYKIVSAPFYPVKHPRDLLQVKIKIKIHLFFLRVASQFFSI